ncbi:unnamed protein product [Parascedosporium putredinis]|uniref:Aminotransferase class I/classII large domain-containing protein n=1 Tax=Parascedosporium putredinis TaxID=1442378 RepID=A0A9P1MDC7_9PEZI|nr:unnamed protein product [Parascedosporium putredinis]CAI7999409.1 unnamed protein product [Parascedosporium putredinis]
MVTTEKLKPAKRVTGQRQDVCPTKGRPRLKKAIADAYSPFWGRTIDPETEVTITTGANEGMLSAFMAFIEEGDEVIVFEPFFDQYISNIEMAGGKIVYVPMSPPKDGASVTSSAANWTIDFDDLERAFTPRTKMIVLNTPHNPVGKIYSKEELERIGDLCVKNQVIILSDEVYDRLFYVPFTRIATLSPEIEKLTLTVGSAGKNFYATGWRVGWLIGPAELIQYVSAAHTRICYSSVSPLQEACAVGFEQAGEHGFWEESIRDMKGKMDRFNEVFDELGLPYSDPEGGYFVLVNMSKVRLPADYPFPPHVAARPRDFQLAWFLIQELGVAAIPHRVLHRRQRNFLLITKPDVALFETRLRVESNAACPGGIGPDLHLRLAVHIQAKRSKDLDRPILFIASCLGGIILAQALVLAAKKNSDIGESTYALEQLIRDFTSEYQHISRNCQLAIFYEMQKLIFYGMVCLVALQISSRTQNCETKDRADLRRFLHIDQCYINLALVEHTSDDATNSSGSENDIPQSSPFSLTSRLKIEKLDATQTIALPALFDQRKLDALCFTWDEGFDSKEGPKTMTTVYCAIQNKLWKKDILRLQPKGEAGQRMKNALMALLKDLDWRVREAAASALGEQSSLSEAAANALTALRKDPDWRVRREAASALGKQSSVSEAVANALTALLKDPNSRVQHAAALALRRQSSPSEAAANALIALLKDLDLDIRKEAALVLGKQSSLSEAAANILIALLKDLDSGVRWEAALALRKQSSLSEAVANALMALLKDPDSRVRQAAASALGRQSSPSEAAANALTALLKDLDSDVRQAAALALVEQSSVSKAAENTLTALLKDLDWRVRRAAASALGKQSSLSEAVANTLTALLKDPDSRVRRAAASALGRQSSPSEAAANALIALLKDPDSPNALIALLKDLDWRVRRAAASALGRQSSPSEAAANALTALVKDLDWRVRRAAASALGRQSSPSEAAANALMALVKDLDWRVRRAAASALGRQSSPSEAAANALTALVKDLDSDVRQAAASALGKQSSLSEAAENALIALIKDPNSDIRQEAALALGRQASLSEAVANALIALLKDSKLLVRREAALALGKKSSLSEAAANALIVLLKDPDSDVRWAAASALGRQSSLSEVVANALIALLKDSKLLIRREAASALGKQSSLSEAGANAFAALLKDQHWLVQSAATDVLGNQWDRMVQRKSKLVY